LVEGLLHGLRIFLRIFAVNGLLLACITLEASTIEAFTKGLVAVFKIGREIFEDASGL
jgi:hypothetical protein